MIPRLVCWIEVEGELHVRIDAEDTNGRDRLCDWLESRDDLRRFVDVLRRMYEIAEDADG